MTSHAEHHPMLRPAATRTDYAAIVFGSCFVCAPRATGRAADQARAWRRAVKQADPALVPYLALEVRKAVRAGAAFGVLFGPDVMLVPVPGSQGESPPWGAWHLACALREAGLASTVKPALVRWLPIPRSTIAARGSRPDCALLYASLEAVRSVPERRRVLLVDDVVSRGRTLLAAARRLRETWPSASVSAFALFRTLGAAQVLEEVSAPCIGRITWSRDDAQRHP